MSTQPAAIVERPYQDHFAQLYHRVIDDTGIGKHGLGAYVALARFADFNSGIAQVRRTKLAEVGRMSVRSLDAGLAELVAAGYLKIHKIQNPDGSWTASKYQLHDTLGAQLATNQTVVSTGGSAGHAPPPSAGHAPGVVQEVHEGGAGPAQQERETFKERQKRGANPPKPVDKLAAASGARAILDEYAAWCAGRGQDLPGSLRGKLATQIKPLLASGLFDARTILGGLLAWHEKQLAPSLLAQFVQHAKTPPAATGTAQRRARLKAAGGAAAIKLRTRGVPGMTWTQEVKQLIEDVGEQRRDQHCNWIGDGPDPLYGHHERREA